MSFQNGVDTIYEACKTYGSTPSTKTPSAIVEAIKTIAESNKGGNYTITAVVGAANYQASGVGLGGYHTYTFDITDGVISCSELNTKFTMGSQVTWAVKNDKDITTIVLNSLSIKEK